MRCSFEVVLREAHTSGKYGAVALKKLVRNFVAIRFS